MGFDDRAGRGKRVQPEAPRSSAVAESLLNAAADLIEPEGAWTQRAFARNSSGDEIDSLSPQALRWNVDGAMYRAVINAGAGLGYLGDMQMLLWDTIGTIESEIWNDDPERTQAEVVAALRGSRATEA